MSSLESHLTQQIEHSRRFFWHRLRWDAVARHVAGEQSLQVVDVGAGAGLLGEFLSRRFPKVNYGFVEQLASLESHLEERFGAASNFRARGSFAGAKIVTLMDVLEHQQDDRGFLADLSGKMDVGAKLVLTVPALPSLWSSWDEALGHFRRYDKRSLRNCVATLPFAVRELSYLFPELLPLGYMRKLRRRSAQPAESEALFPDPPALVNEALYRAGAVSLALRRWWPAGTSLLAVMERV